MHHALAVLASLSALVCSLLLADPAAAAPVGDCTKEPQLDGRSDVLMCEPWDSPTWWSDDGFTANGGKAKYRPITADMVDKTQVVSSGCVQGNCLEVTMYEGETRSLNIHWPIDANTQREPEELYFRYYMKIGPNWDPYECDADGNRLDPPGGKFPGFADVRDNNIDAYGQCGNGGASSDGINCWSARGLYRGCDNIGANGFPYTNTCEWVPGAVTRIGSYIYVPDNTVTHGAAGVWDFVAEDQTLGPDYTSACRREVNDPSYSPNPACFCNSSNNFGCGIGTGGMLLPGRWYAIETYVKMNTPGVADGILRGWIDGVPSYEKTNMIYRKPGHDNLHVRTVWLNIYKGGVNGNCQTGKLWLDQMVVADQYIGPFGAVRPSAPPNLDVQ